ncbi:50S ribosomal protein L10 [Candidatus Gracilibacteria bacterium]|nr:50S ribosomal protein L10 [Candidatus Gracilibacteria bacterium]
MAVTRKRKQEILEELVRLFKESKSVAVTKYSGTAVNDVNALRGDMFKKNIKLVVAKKTLINLAAKEAGYPEVPKSVMEGPVALAFCMDDEVAAAKAIKDAAKELDTLGLLGGFMEGRVLSQKEATQLADVPPFEVLMSQLVRAMKSPISGFHGALHGTLRNFVGVLDAVKNKQEADGAN